MELKKADQAMFSLVVVACASLVARVSGYRSVITTTYLGGGKFLFYLFNEDFLWWEIFLYGRDFGIGCF